MSTRAPQELWEPLNNEPPRAYRAFESFLLLPSADRTLLAAYRSHVGNPHAPKPSDTWSQWSSRYAWRERAAAYDAHMASLRRGAYERGVEEEAERQGILAERMRAETFEMLDGMYQRASQWLEREDFDAREMNMSHVIQVAKLHLDVAKAFETVERPRRDDEWTEADDVDLDGILKEIETECDARGEPGEGSDDGVESQGS